MATQEERRALTRQKILDAAATLFLENGFEGTTLAQILEQAGIVKGTFYQHFQTKLDLLVTLGWQNSAERVGALIAEVRQGTSALDALERYYRVMVQWFEAYPAIAEDVIISAIRLHDPQSDSPTLIAHDFTKLMIQTASKRGELRTDIDAVSQAIVLGGAFTIAVIDWSRDARPQKLQKRFDACFQLFLQGAQASSQSKPSAKAKRK